MNSCVKELSTSQGCKISDNYLKSVYISELSTAAFHLDFPAIHVIIQCCQYSATWI